MFKDNREYQSFLAWALNGSTIGQRMQMGECPPIPKHWEHEAPLFRRLFEVDQIPKTYEDYLQWIHDAEMDIGEYS